MEGDSGGSYVSRYKGAGEWRGASDSTEYDDWYDV